MAADRAPQAPCSLPTLHEPPPAKSRGTRQGHPFPTYCCVRRSGSAVAKPLHRRAPRLPSSVSMCGFRFRNLGSVSAMIRPPDCVLPQKPQPWEHICATWAHPWTHDLPASLGTYKYTQEQKSPQLRGLRGVWRKASGRAGTEIIFRCRTAKRSPPADRPA